jgi:hypothetical protein
MDLMIINFYCQVVLTASAKKSQRNLARLILSRPGGGIFCGQIVGDFLAKLPKYSVVDHIGQEGQPLKGSSGASPAPFSPLPGFVAARVQFR